MKRMYWRPQRVSRTALLLISVWSVVGYAAVERFQIKAREPFFKEKLVAAKRARDAFEVIRRERMRRRLDIDEETDVGHSGLIGELVTPITTNPGSLISKQTTINPNFAALIVDYLARAGVKEGDVVAVGYSGSFPATNIAVLAAIEALKAKAVIISSASSSQWGANDPRFSWLEMERILYEQKVFSARSVAASVGGIEDRGLGMTKRGSKILHQQIAEHGLRLIDPVTFQESVDTRLKLYQDHAAGQPIRAYVNVGGGTTSVGRKAGKLSFKPGLNLKAPMKNIPSDSVMGRFIGEGVPVVHLIKMMDFAEKYGFPIAPVVPPPVGEGRVFRRERPSPLFAGFLLTTIILALYLFVRSDLGFRMTRTGSRPGGGAHAEPMV